MRADYCLDHIVAQSLCWQSMRGDENMWARALTNDVDREYDTNRYHLKNIGM